MRYFAVDWHPPRRHLRQFAWGTALFLAVLSLAGGPSASLRLLAAFLFALGTVLPSVLRWPYVGVLLFVNFLAQVVDRFVRTFALHPAPRQGLLRAPTPMQEQADPQPSSAQLLGRK